MTQGKFGLLIFGNLMQWEEIYHTGSRNKCQSTTKMIIILFYRHKKRDNHLVIVRIDNKPKRDLIQFRLLNIIEECRKRLYIKDNILLYYLFLGFGKYIFIPSLSFFESTSTGCSIPFRRFYKNHL